MYPTRFIQYVNLPKIPNHILANISSDPANYKFNSGTYWTDQHNQELNAWCQQNICAEMYFAFQCFTELVPCHRDVVTQIKLNYIISPGGNNTITKFYSADQNTLVDQYCIEPYRWHIFQANVPHSVDGIEPGHVRFAVTARVF